MNSFRYAAFFLAFIFLVFGILQYNDPDPYIWMPVYGIAALISFGMAFNRINTTILIVAMILYFIGAVYMWPSSYEGIVLDMGYKVEIEEARESLGLLICGLTMGYYIFVLKRRNRKIRSF